MWGTGFIGTRVGLRCAAPLPPCVCRFSVDQGVLRPFIPADEERRANEQSRDNSSYPSSWIHRMDLDLGSVTSHVRFFAYKNR